MTFESTPEERNFPNLGMPEPSLSSLYKTWTGRILLVNTVVFILMCWDGGSILFPSAEIMSKYGAKDTSRLVSGEYWRLVTPMFVHIGLIHFAINSLALFYIGQQIEKMIGSSWFVTIYFFSGVAGGVASAVFTTGLSAGASGAIFGLVGVGFVFERLIAYHIKRATGTRLRKGPYTGLVIINIVIGFILTSGPVRIDNAAHLGGLFSGIVLSLVLLRTTPNRLLTRSRWQAVFFLAAFFLLVAIGGTLGISKDFHRWNLERQLEKNEGRQQQFYVLSEAIKVFPSEKKYYYERGRLLALNGEMQAAFEDFDQLKDYPGYREKLRGLVYELEVNGQHLESLKLQDYLAR